MDRFSHLDEEGKARMVDVGGKPPVKRTALASGRIHLSPRTLELVRENRVAKGDVLAVARIAGIQAAKQAAGLIPLCHPLPLDHVEVDFSEGEGFLEARARVKCTARTGVEMEALASVSVALLTVYDMCKAVDGSMRISDIHLLEKRKEAPRGD